MPLCYKCRTAPATITNRSGACCFDCLLSLVLRQTKNTFSGFRVPKNSTILIPFSGGKCSTLLVHMLTLCVNGTGRSRMPYQLAGVYVDTSLLFPEDPNDSLYYVSLLSEELKFKYDVISLESCTFFKNDKNYCKQFFDNIKNIDNKIDLLQIFIQQCILEYAQSHNYLYVAFSNTLNDISVEILARTVSGKGYSIPYYVSPSSPILTTYGVHIIYPFSAVTTKEIACYCYYKHIQYSSQHYYNLQRTKNNSINFISTNLISSLQDHSRTTIHTLSEIPHKLANTEMNQDQICVLCHEYGQKLNEKDLYYEAKKEINHQYLCPHCLSICEKEQLLNLFPLA
ncbi:hypothetical protein WA158_008345 [Blastocystis sp. Blastoise]